MTRPSIRTAAMALAVSIAAIGAWQATAAAAAKKPARRPGARTTGVKTGTPSAAIREAITHAEQGVRAVKLTGDADLDFVNVMMAYQQGGLSIARIEAHGGKDDKLRELAARIIGA